MSQTNACRSIVILMHETRKKLQESINIRTRVFSVVTWEFVGNAVNQYKPFLTTITRYSGFRAFWQLEASG